MNTQPDIIISELDYARIESLLQVSAGIPANIKTALETELERAELVEPEKMPGMLQVRIEAIEYQPERAGEFHR